MKGEANLTSTCRVRECFNPKGKARASVGMRDSEGSVVTIILLFTGKVLGCFLKF